MCSLPALKSSNFESAIELQYIGRRKCGDVSISLDVKNVILHCIFCEFENDTLEIFFNHLKSNHLSQLSADIIQMEQDGEEIQVKQEFVEEEAIIPQQCELPSIEINSPIIEATNIKNEANDMFAKLKTVGYKLNASEIKPLCVFCCKNKGTLISFTETSLEKCKYILMIRQSNNLGMKDSKVPLVLNDFQKYHSKCYAVFTALSKKYRPFLLSALTTSASRSEGEIKICSANASEKAAVEIEDIPADSLLNNGNQSLLPNTIKPKDEDYVQNITYLPVSSAPKEYVCIFCTKKRKKHHNKEQRLITLTKDDSLKILKCNALEMGDINLFNRIDEICSNNEIILYHRICKLNYSNALRTQITTKSEKKQWHITRDIHKQAFQEVCNFVLENTVKDQQYFFLSFLKSLFVDYTKNHNIDLFTGGMEPHNFDSKLLEAFPKKISIITIKQKKVVKPYNGFLFDNDLEAIEKEDILERAVLILRSEIRTIQRNLSSDKLRINDLIIEEYNSTKILGDLEIALKCLENGKKIIKILNKNVQRCYFAQKELNTNATHFPLRSDICAEYLSQTRKKELLYNKSDGFVGNDALLNTVGIIFRNINASRSTQDYFGNIKESESFTSLRKRRRTFDL